MPDSSQPDVESPSTRAPSLGPSVSNVVLLSSLLQVGLGLFLAATLLYITAPLIAHSWSLVIPRELSDPSLMTLSEEVRVRALRVFVIGWILTLGMCVGSFLNVVIYRSPRGRTLLGSSKCPRCRHPIRARHNIPVLGWVLLRGRCHDCGLPISIRYPVVEATVGAVFLAVAAVELFAGGWNLPLYARQFPTGIVWFMFSPRAEFIRLGSLHVALLTVLLSWGLMQWDRVRLPPAYRLASLAIPLSLSMLFPGLYPVLYNGVSGLGATLPAWTDGLLTAAVGGVWGSFVGWLLAACGAWWHARGHDLGPRREFLREVESGFGLVGLVLGWQAVSLLGLLIALGLALISRTFLARRWETTWLLWLFTVTWIYILLWRPLSMVTWLPGPQSSGTFHLLVLLLACGLIHRVRP